MSRDFLAFWRLETLDAALQAHGLINYAASNQYSRVKVGDTVWLVSVRSGRLRLIGRVVVGQVTDRDGAARLLGTDRLWAADHYILPATADIRPVVDIDIHHLVPELRFRSAGGSDRLVQDEDGAVSGQQLQALRVLAGDSPRLLSEALGV
jgi:hypothetical protein